MSRFPSELERAYLQYESEERFKRIERVWQERRRRWREQNERRVDNPAVITDHDPGDEDRHE